MKLDQYTIRVLSNFAVINEGIAIEAGSTLKTIHPNKSVLAIANVNDVFPQDFAIIDLKKFLNCLSLFSEPELNFQSKSVTIKSGSNEIQFKFGEPSLIIRPPNKNISLPSVDAEINLRKDQFEYINKTSQILNCEDVELSGNGGSIKATILDKTNSSSNSSSVELLGTHTTDFKAYLKIQNLKFISGNYTIKISSKGLALFTHTIHDLKYYVAIESDSQF